MTDIAAYYDQLAAQHGATPAAVDASSQEVLDARYRALGDVTDLNGKRVLEVGCGYGGLGAYLTDRYPEIDYRGIDISAQLLELGRTAHPELRLDHADLRDFPECDRYDVVLAQGIFYKTSGWAATREMITRLYALTDEVAAFTAIIERPGANGGEYRLNAHQTLRFCRRLAPRVSYRNNYHPGDALFALYRKAL